MIIDKIGKQKCIYIWIVEDLFPKVNKVIF